ncbi:MAG: hypothetical protein A2Z25_05930 [Planctomycetes bacterium RBG_16_55_9]|nr:MAG: hypothetical protein A2Z25_05930 [Planctomycetes bacterium RBG_16_55_9]
MWTRKTIWGVVAVFVIVGLLLVGQTLSQPGQRGQAGGMQGPQGQGPGGRQFDPEQMRQMMEQRMQEALGATDQEWKVLGPRVMKVQDLSRQTGGGGRGMMMFGRGMRGGPGGPGAPGGDRPGGRGMGTNRELTEVDKIQEALQTTLDNTSATPDQIKQELTKLRAAREKAKQELAKAQQDLRQVLTVRQEATLVLMGMLD